MDPAPWTCRDTGWRWAWWHDGPCPSCGVASPNVARPEPRDPEPLTLPARVVRRARELYASLISAA